MRKKILSKLTIKKAMIFSLMTGIIVPLLLISALMLYMLNNQLYKAKSDSAKAVVHNNAQVLESMISNISYTAAYIISSDEISADVLTINNAPRTPESIFARERLLKRIRNISNATLNSFNPDVAIILPSGDIYGFEYNYRIENSKSLFDSALWQDKHSIWSDVLSSGIDHDLSATWVIRSRGEIIALLRIRIPHDNLWDKLSTHPLLEYQQDILSNDSVFCTNQMVVGNVKTTIFEETLENWDISLRVTIPTSVLTQNMQQQLQIFIVCLVVLSSFQLLAINLVTRLITQPIQDVLKQMHRLQLGDFCVTPSPGSFQEINKLSETLNDVSLCIDGLTQTAAEQAALKERMHFEALMAQINPHFLYNTLNSIRWLAAISGNNAVADMLVKLGSMLYYSYGVSSTEISLREELAFLDEYVSLMQMRWGNAFMFEKDIPDELLELLIPRSCLQPLVENSISHGIHSIPNAKIEIKACIKPDNNLQVTVSDNGEGMTFEKASELLQEKNCGSNYSFSGIGVPNVHHRIQLLYGQDYGLSISSSPGNGCTITITLPHISKEDSGCPPC